MYINLYMYVYIGDVACSWDIDTCMLVYVYTCIYIYIYNFLCVARVCRNKILQIIKSDCKTSFVECVLFPPMHKLLKCLERACNTKTIKCTCRFVFS